ncbi:MAG: electron transport complex protein RnfC [Firmicutes bacterium]|nr:electron transport complex protein RnfC [Bacillota bacterium]
MNADRKELIANVRAAGVVGAGGAGFPTHVKLAGSVDTIILNGAECEPLLAVDVQLLELQAETLVETLGEVVEILGAKAGVITIKAKHQLAIEALKQALVGKANLRLHPLEDFYPVGDEQVLVYEVLGRTVPEGGIPPDVGGMVINVETLLNVAKAQRGQPVTATYVTIAGAVSRPLTLEVPVGTPISVLLDLAGGPTVPHYRVIEGGPMTGELISQPAIDSHIAAAKKTTTGVIVLPADHWLVSQPGLNLGIILQRAQSACCQCRICTDLCPRHLLGHDLNPHLILNALNHGQASNPDAYTQAFLCSDCGVCELYACPVELSPRRVYQAIKLELTRQGLKNPHRRKVTPKVAWVGRHIPISSLISRLGLEKYDHPAPLSKVEFSLRQVAIALQQHIGVSARALVKAGDKVEIGQIIATPPPDKLGAVLHASISGRIKEVTEAMVVIAGE